MTQPKTQSSGATLCASYKKNVINKTFYFRGRQTIVQKFTPHPVGGWGVTLKLQMLTYIFFRKTGFCIKKYVKFLAKIFFKFIIL